jgi:peptidoglycan/xylan/chitin deacetylase (PgdA/CDA1 family)
MLIEQTPKIFRAFFPDVIWQIPQKEKTVYLTFDDGPVPAATSFVLELLEKHAIKATFFCVGDNVCKYPDLFRQIVKAGHQTGNHTFSHLQGFKYSAEHYLEDVEKADTVIKSRLFRPPHGQFRHSQLIRLKEKYEIVLWDVITRDYNRSLSGEYVANVVKKYARNGSIIVFHASVRAEKNMKYALPRAIDFLLEEGYRFETLNPRSLRKTVELTTSQENFLLGKAI